MRGHGDFDCGNPPERQERPFSQSAVAQGGPRRNSDGAYRRRRVGLLQRSRSCAPSSFCRGLLHSDGCFQHSFPLPVVGRAHSLCLPDKLRLGGFLLLLCRFPCTGGDSACGKLAAWHFADSVLLPHLASAVGAFIMLLSLEVLAISSFRNESSERALSSSSIVLMLTFLHIFCSSAYHSFAR